MTFVFTIFFSVGWFKTHQIDTAASMDQVDDTSSDSASMAQETAVTVILTTFLLLVRTYFTLVLVGFARQTVRRENLRRYNGPNKGSLEWKAQVVLLSVFEGFWTGFKSTNDVNDSENSVDLPLMETEHDLEAI